VLSVALVVPTWHYFANPFKLQPLHELYFATVIDDRFKRRKVKATVIDLRLMRKKEGSFNEDKLGAYVNEYSVYLYWIMKTADYLEVEATVTVLRKLYPESLHIAGGTHVETFPQESKEFFDAIVLGPGEKSFVEALKDIEDNNLKKVYNGDWESSHYNDYPFPRRTYLPKEDTVNTDLFEKYQGILGTSAMFSRGCHFRCAYCVYNVPGKIQMRSPKKIEEEINYLKSTYDIKGVNLRDEICTPLNPKVSIPYLEAIGRCNVVWRGQTKVGAGKEVMKLARQSGCVELALGVESASQQVLDIIDKKQTLDQARETMSICHELDIKIKMCLILGLPGEPQDIVERTIKFIEETQPDYINVSGFCPVPGSKIFQDQKYYGLKHVDSDWSKHAHLIYRFGDDESFGLPFEYEETNQWGKAFSKKEIVDNIKELQHYAAQRSMSY
jgi:radical SAM superfamily enzyme YgiQ (UPF0313 family)